MGTTTFNTKNSAFCPSVYLCFSHGCTNNTIQLSPIALNTRNTHCVLCEVRTGCSYVLRFSLVSKRLTSTTDCFQPKDNRLAFRLLSQKPACCINGRHRIFILTKFGFISSSAEVGNEWCHATTFPYAFMACSEKAITNFTTGVQTARISWVEHTEWLGEVRDCNSSLVGKLE
jgi:hypothetical protein